VQSQERVTQVGLYAIGTSPTLESNKSPWSMARWCWTRTDPQAPCLAASCVVCNSAAHRQGSHGAWPFT